MRRVVSIIFFALGGWMLTSEAMLAFFGFESPAETVALALGIILMMAVAPLLIGAWVSPGRRWRELGVTLLAVGGVALFMAVTMGLFLIDPALKDVMPPLPEGLSFAPVAGTVNLLVITGLGWVLYRKAPPAGQGDLESPQ